jgi:hypothetical protein
MRVSLAAGIALLALFGASAVAHEVRPGFLELRETSPGEFATTWKVPALGAMRLAIEPDYPSFCRAIGEPVTSFVDDAFVQRGRLRCDEPLAGAKLAIRGLVATQTDVLVRIETADGESFTGRILPSSPSLVVPVRPGLLALAATYVDLGIEHILLGVDHLLFVLGLILLVDGTRRLIWTITAFTVGHSISLAAATFGWVGVPEGPLNAVIALSIVFVAVEVVHRYRGEVGLTARFPWVFAFAFGLLHGLGFATALTSLGIPQSMLPLALLFFNIGVEIGQLAFVLLIVLLRWANRTEEVSLPRWTRPIPAYAIGGVAMFWFIGRAQLLLFAG